MTKKNQAAARSSLAAAGLYSSVSSTLDAVSLSGIACGISAGRLQHSSTKSIPIDLDKLKSFEDLILVIKNSGIELHVDDPELGIKYGTRDWIKENAPTKTPLGKAINEEK